MWFKYPLTRPGYTLKEEIYRATHSCLILSGMIPNDDIFVTWQIIDVFLIGQPLKLDEIPWIPRWSHGPKTKNGWPRHQSSGKVAPRFLLLRWWCCWLLSMFDIQQFQGLRIQVQEDFSIHGRLVCVSKMMYPQKSRGTSLKWRNHWIFETRPKKLQH